MNKQSVIITGLHIENVKRLRAVNITPGAEGITIGGDNGQGKSSVLDSIEMAFAGKSAIPSVPVHQGAEKGKIVATLSNGLVVRRTFVAGGGTAVTVENGEGARYASPQAILDALYGALSFDPLEFSLMGKTADGRRKQLETLQKLVGLDLTELNATRKRIYDERTVLNKDVDRVQVAFDAMPNHADAPAVEQDPAELLKELETAQEHNRKEATLRIAVTSAESTLGEFRAAINETRATIAELEARLARAKADLAEGEKQVVGVAAEVERADAALKAFVAVPVEPIREKINNVKAVNAKVAANVQRADALKALNEKKVNAKALTEQIEKIDREKADKLAAVKFPLPGLTFGDDGVLLNGLPLDQASRAEDIRLSVAIAAALNPTLKVMLVRDGSLLDKKSRALLADLAREHGLQVWMEVVGEGAHVGVVIEDGAVAGAAVEAGKEGV